jgi:hypothetical protein
MIHGIAVQKLVVVQTKLYLREPMGVFFTLLFAPLLLVVMGFIFGNEPMPMFDGLGQLDVYVPTYAAIVIGVVGLTAVPIETSARRETACTAPLPRHPFAPPDLSHQRCAGLFCHDSTGHFAAVSRWALASTGFSLPATPRPAGGIA